MIITLIIFFIVLGILVCFHEFGHFIMAKLWRVRVDEFGFGFPPRLFGVRFKNTLYSLNVIPLGGFVRIKGIAGENIDQVDEDAVKDTSTEIEHDTDSYASRPHWQQFTILIGGIAANCLLAWILFSASLFIGVATPVSSDATEALPSNADSRIIVTGVAPQSSAETAGLLVGDVIAQRDSADVHTYADVQSAPDAAVGTIERLQVQRKGQDIEISAPIEARTGEDGGTYAGIGISLSQVYTQKLGFGQAIMQGGQATISGIGSIFVGLWNLVTSIFSGHGTGGALAGPVGIAQITGQAYDLGFSTLLQLMAVLSINLAVFNLLPIPALDGGRFAFLLIEVIRGKKVNERIEATVHSIGFLLLLGIIVLVTYQDIARIFLGSA